jgi:UV DNA damage endonuclease
MRELKRKDRKTGKRVAVFQPPVWSGHADFCQPFEFISVMRQFKEASFDVMLEAKSKDLALLRLRRDLQRYAPDVAQRFGLEPSDPVLEEPATIEIPEPAVVL